MNKLMKLLIISCMCSQFSLVSYAETATDLETAPQITAGEEPCGIDEAAFDVECLSNYLVDKLLEADMNEGEKKSLLVLIENNIDTLKREIDLLEDSKKLLLNKDEVNKTLQGIGFVGILIGVGAAIPPALQYLNHGPISRFFSVVSIIAIAAGVTVLFSSRPIGEELYKKSQIIETLNRQLLIYNNLEILFTAALSGIQK